MESSGVYGRHRCVTTLPGMGPRITLSDVTWRAFREEYERELERFEWLMRHVEPFLERERIDTWLKRVYENPRAPGSVEAGLVALCLLSSDHTIAALVLDDFEPPANDPDLAKLHRLCRAIARHGGIRRG